MITRLLIGIGLAIACAGCSSEDNGNVVEGAKSAAAAPKSASDLKKDMPPEARAAAAASMGSAQAQTQMNSDPARVHAMEMMKKQRGQ